MSHTSPRHGAFYDSGASHLAHSEGRRSRALAERLIRGANALAAVAGSLTDAQWETRVPNDGRRIGVIVHHVGSMYPLEMKLALTLAEGRPVIGVTMEDVNAINADHAAEHDSVSKQDAIDLLLRNSATAAHQIRKLSNAELDRAAPVSLYGDAPLTCQFFIEDHALRHSYHHLARIRGTLDAVEHAPQFTLD